MEDLHLCLFSPPPSLCLSACVKQCLLCILASHSRQMERWLLFRSWQGCFPGCHLQYAPLPLFLMFGLGESGEAVPYQRTSFL